MFSDEDIEREIQDKGLTAPRVTAASIENEIVSEWYFTAADGVYGAGNGVAKERPGSLSRLTFCVLVLKNGFSVTGESPCLSDEGFDPELGRKIARKNAFDKCWMLFNFHLASKLAEQE